MTRRILGRIKGRPPDDRLRGRYKGWWRTAQCPLSAIIPDRR